MTILNIAAYKFVPLRDLQENRDRLRAFCRDRELRGTILISAEGINMFVAGSREYVHELLSIVRAIPGLEDLTPKESLTDYQPFNRMIVKLKREIIPVGCDGIQPEQNASPKLAPKELKRWLDEGREIALLDTRNDYETAVGTFQGAIDLNLKNFRQFPKAAESLPEDVKKKPVVMFCTGGIRCEKIGPYMKGLGFEEIYQLEGGILKYFEECKQSHYDGDCFVFDQRVAVDPALSPSPAEECFACKHVLMPEDLLSPKYVIAKSCPFCYRDPEEVRAEAIEKHRHDMLRIAKEQRGCTPYENRRWISIPQRSAGLPLLEALVDFYPGYDRDRWLMAIHNGEIQVPASSKREWKTTLATPEQIVREGERFLHVIPDYVEPPINPEIRLIHEDDAIVVIHKSAPLPLHPSGRFNLNTLESILNAAYFPERLRPAHRIDSNTTGLVVFARKHSFASKLQPQFANGNVSKSYLAIVDGSPSWETIECSESISAEPLANGGRAIDPNGQSAQTRFQVVERRQGSSLVEATPATGRTHQIRLHLAWLGHPLINDPLYLAGGNSRVAPDSKRNEKPLGLHAWRISFTHPQSGERVSFEAPFEEAEILE